MAIGTSANAVMKITGMLLPRATSSSNRSSPLVSGIRTSKTRQPGPVGAKSRRKSAAEGKVLTRRPTVFITKRSESSMSGSSSTMYTVGSCIIDNGGRECERERRAYSGLRIDGNPSLVGFDDGPAYGQSHAHSRGTGAEIRVENHPETLG